MRVLLGNGPWMVWNTFLALIPLVLAFVVFRRDRQRLTVWWWFGTAAFVAFLPNAPYVLTDAIHIRGDLGATSGQRLASIALLIEYGTLILIGLAAYTGSLELARRFLTQRGLSRASWRAIELSVHLACAVGVLLGRFARFNSWDLGLRPTVVARHLGVRIDNPGSWRLLIGTFAVLLIGTTCTRAAVRLLRGPFDHLRRL